MNRPEIGTITERNVEVEICVGCGCTIENDLCDYYCKYDCGPRQPDTIIIATYHRVDTLISETVK